MFGRSLVVYCLSMSDVGIILLNRSEDGYGGAVRRAEAREIISCGGNQESGRLSAEQRDKSPARVSAGGRAGGGGGDDDWRRRRNAKGADGGGGWGSGNVFDRMIRGFTLYDGVPGKGQYQKTADGRRACSGPVHRQRNGHWDRSKPDDAVTT